MKLIKYFREVDNNNDFGIKITQVVRYKTETYLLIRKRNIVELK